MALYRSYQPASRCTGGPCPGAKAFMAWFLGCYGERGGKNLGIYNCRTVRGGSTTSLHGEGRACDLGINPHGAAYGDEVAELLRVHSAELGVQCIIWDRRIWSGAHPDAGWREYSGKADHRDHIHVEFSRTAADTLTPETIESVLTPRRLAPAPVPAPQPRPREDDCMLIKTQPDKTKPVILTALLSGPMFIGLGPTETPSDEQAKAMGLPVLWVEMGTWQDMDRRSHALCASPVPVTVQNFPPQPTTRNTAAKNPSSSSPSQ